MKIITLLVLTLLATKLTAIKMILYVSTQEGPKCLYHYLNAGEKYYLSGRSLNQQQYRIEVFKQNNTQWVEVYNKEVVNSYDSINKMASSHATHMFCFSNSHSQIMKIGVQFKSGLELGQTASLPTKTDHSLLDQNIDFLENQKQKVIEILSRIEGGQASNNLRSSSGRKLIIFAVVGLVAILAINYLFFYGARKTLKDRKLI